MDKHDVTLSIIENFGGTFGVSRGYGIPEYFLSPKRTGYMVAIAGSERKIPFHQFTAADVGAYVKRYSDLLRGVGYYFGAWVSDGFVYLDISNHYTDRREAENTGRNNGQLAIWGVRLKHEITL